MSTINSRPDEVTILELEDSSGDELAITSAGGVYFFHVGQWERRGFFTATPEQALEMIRALVRSMNLQEEALTALANVLQRYPEDWEAAHTTADGHALALLAKLGCQEFAEMAEGVPAW